jgi:hypothetical protein
MGEEWLEGHAGHGHDEEGNCIMSPDDDSDAEEDEDFEGEDRDGEEEEEGSEGDDDSAETEEGSEDEDFDDEASDASDGSESSVSDINTPHCRGAHLALLFLQTFLRTMSSSWSGLDIYRLDKFYSLLRKTLAEVFKYMKKRDWHLGIVRQFNDVLVDEVLLRIPNGMRFHFIDIAIEELSKVDCDIDTAAFISIIEPYMALAQVEDDKVVREKVLENIFLRFLTKYSNVCDSPAEDDIYNTETEKPCFENVVVADVAEWIFDAAKDESTRDNCRKGLYEMNKSYLKRIKKREGGGARLASDMYTNKDVEEAPEELLETSMEIDEETRLAAVKEMSESSAKKAKKEKKSKKLAEEAAAAAAAAAEKEKEEEEVERPSAKKQKKSQQAEPVVTSEKKKRRPSVDITEMNNSDDDYKSPTNEVNKDRRLSWGVNKSKSYKKSITDLKSKELILSPPPKTGVLKSPRYSSAGKGVGSNKKKRPSPFE